jgi:hypothetical protein
MNNSKWAVAAVTDRAKTALTRRTPRPVSFIMMIMPTAGTTTMSMFTMQAVDTITVTISTKKKSMFIMRVVGMTMGISITIMHRKKNRVSIKNEIN